MKTEKQCRFTIIELLIVTAVITILISMLLPVLQNMRQKAQRIVCTSNLKQIGQGCMLYINDFNDYLPLSSSSSDTDHFTTVLMRYTGNRNVETIKYNNYSSVYFGGIRCFHKWGSLYACPVAMNPSNFSITASDAARKNVLFSSNYAPTRGTPGVGAEYAWHQSDSAGAGNITSSVYAVKLHDVKGKLLCGELRYFNVSSSYSNVTCTVSQIYSWYTQSFLNTQYAPVPHGDSGNWLYKDGHVKAHKPSNALIRRGNLYFSGLD